MFWKIKRKLKTLKRRNRIEQDSLRDYLFRKQLLKMEDLQQPLVKSH